MGYQALYREFRLKTFSDMVGQEHITKTLQNALVREKFSHAYLFNGPRGTGKTSAAKVFAKAVNCDHAPVSEPCNECEPCRGIADGSISDVIEIDAASNNGVDEIREIRDKVKYAPNAVRYKVYIIDEVHMLSTGAFNALLKTLEEPPAHVIFILATTEPHKIPLTIISRCQRFDFKRINQQAVIERLQVVVDEKSLDVTDRALDLVAKACEGGMRDALSILDQALAYSEDTIGDDDVREITGMVSQQWLADVVDAISDKNAPNAVQTIQKLFEAGKDPERFVEDLILYYRDMLLYQTSSDLKDQLSRAEPNEQFIAQAKGIDAEGIYTVITDLNRTQQEMKWTNHTRVFLEVAVVRLCRQEQSQPASSVQADNPSPVVSGKIEALEKRLAELEEKGVTVQKQNPTSSQPQRKAQRSAAGFKSKRFSAPEQELRKVLQSAAKPHLKEMRASWADVMEKVKYENVAAHAWLLESKPVASSEEAFIQAFKFDFHCQMVAENKNNSLDMVERFVSETTGKTKKMYPVPIQQWDDLKKIYINEMEAKKDSTPSQAEVDTDSDDDALIKEAEKLVGTDLLEIRD